MALSSERSGSQAVCPVYYGLSDAMNSLQQRREETSRTKVVSAARILVLSSSLEVLELAIAFVFHTPRPRRLSIQVQPVPVSSVETRSKRNRGFSSHVRMRATIRLPRFFLYTWSRVEHGNMDSVPTELGQRPAVNGHATGSGKAPSHLYQRPAMAEVGKC